MNRIKFEKMQSSQLKQMSDFARIIFKEHYDPIVGEETNAYMIDNYLSERGIFDEVQNGAEYFFVKLNGKEAGILAIDTKPDFMYLSKFYLAKEYRGNGYAREMMDYVEKRAIDCGLNKIRLNVNAGNIDTISTYRHFGFQIIEELQKELGEGYRVHDYVMERKLD